MASPKPVLRQNLASLLWSRREKEQARGSLRQSVHELQDTLGPAWSHLLTVDRHHLSLRGPELEIDALVLAQPGTFSAELLSKFEDVLLEDLNGLDPAFDRWLDEERNRFLRIGRTVGETLLSKAEEPAAVIEAAEQLLAIDRLHEGAWRAIMRGQAERGDLTAALAAYEQCRSLIAGSSDGRLSPDTEDLADKIRAQSELGLIPLPGVSNHRVAEPQVAAITRPTGQRRDRSALRLRVMPFRLIGNADDNGFELGLAEEISAGLSRFRWISCVPTSLWPDRSSGLDDPLRSGAGPGADLVLDGTIQFGVGRVRVIVRLIDMRTDGEIAWAGRFDRPIADPLSLQDELGASIVAQVDPELMKHEGRRTAGEQSQDLTAQDLLLQALPAIYQLERSSFVNARKLLEASLRADPGSSVAHGWLAYWNLLYVGQGWAADAGSSAAEAARLAERAIMLDPGDARALTLAGHVRGFLGKHPEEASALHERALALNPNLALAWCFSGLSCFYLGRHEEAVQRITQAIRLSPSDPHLFFFDMALIMPYMMAGDFIRAVDAGRRAIELNPLFSSAYKGYLSALGWVGKAREAKEVQARLLLLEPGFSVVEAIARSPMARVEDIARYAEGLRRAGLPEHGIGAATRAHVLIEQSAIDLAPIAQHSPVPMRDDSHNGGRLWNDRTW